MDPIPYENPFAALFSDAKDAALGAASMLPQVNPFANLAKMGGMAKDAFVEPKVRPDPDTSHLRDDPIIDIEGGVRGHFRAARSLTQALKEARAAGHQVSLNSGFRTRDEQAALFAAKGPGWAAAPGHSVHEKGHAFDINLPEAAAGILEKFGFARPYDHEPWHFAYQPGLPAGHHERVWKDDDPRMQRFRQGDTFFGSPKHLAQSVVSSAGYSDRDTSIFLRMWNQESGFNPEARSPVGARGIGQIMPENLPDLLVKIGHTLEEYDKNPGVQIKASLAFMQGQLEAYDGNWAQALAAYNGGPGAVAYAKKHGFFPQSEDESSWYVQTLDYVAKILDTDRATAMKWIAGTEEGPVAHAVDQEVETARAQESLAKQVQGWVGEFSQGWEEGGMKGAFRSLFGATPLPGGQVAQTPTETGAVLDAGTPGIGQPPRPRQTEPKPFEPNYRVGPSEDGRPMSYAGTTMDGSHFYRNSQGRLVSQQGHVLPPDMTLEADKHGQRLVSRAGEKSPESWGTWGTRMAHNTGEVGKTFLRGLVGGFGALYEMAGNVRPLPTNLAVGPAAGMLPDGTAKDAVLGPRLRDVLPWDKLPWKEFQKAVEPTPGGYHAQNKETAKNLRGGQGFLEWLWSTRPGFVGGTKPFLDTEAWTGNAMDLSTEAPYLAGMEIMAMFLGPRPGGLLEGTRRKLPMGTIALGPRHSGFTGEGRALGLGGELTYEIARLLPGIGAYVERVGKPFFQEMSIWGGLNAMQMATEVSARGMALEGKSLQETAADALTAGMMGYMVGMGIPLGVMAGGGALGALARGGAKVAPHIPLPVDGGAPSVPIRDVLKFTREAWDRWPGRELAAGSILDMVKYLDSHPELVPAGVALAGTMLGQEGAPMAALAGSGLKPGWMTARILQSVREGQKAWSAVRDHTFKVETVRVTREHAQELVGQGQIIRQTAQAAEQKVQKLQTDLKGLQDVVEAAEQSHPEIRQAAERMDTAVLTRESWDSANGAMLAVGKAQDKQAALREWFQTYGAQLGLKDPSDFSKAYAAAKKEFEKELATIEQDHGVPIPLIQAYRETLDGNKAPKRDAAGTRQEPKMGIAQLEPALQGAQGDAVFKNLQQQYRMAEVFDWMGKRVNSIADSFEKGQIPARAPETNLDPTWAQDDWNSMPQVDMSAMEVQLRDYDDGLVAVIQAGLTNDPVKNPLAYQSTRYLRALLESKTGSIPLQIKNTLLSLASEKKYQESIANRKIEYKPAPSRKRAETDPDYEEAYAEWERKKAIWDRDHKPALEAERKAARERIKEIDAAAATLVDSANQMTRTGTLSASDAGKVRSIQKKADEITADLEAQTKAAGFGGGIQEVRDLLAKPAKSVNKLLQKFRLRDKPSKAPRVMGKKEVYRQIGPRPTLTDIQQQDAVRGVQRNRNQQIAALKQARSSWEARKQSLMGNRSQQQQSKSAWKSLNDAYKAKVEQIKANGKHVFVREFPKAWLDQAQLRPQGGTPIPAPRGNKRDPIILGGSGEIIDGVARIADAAGDTVRAWVPESIWKQMVVARLPERVQNFVDPGVEPVTIPVPGAVAQLAAGRISGVPGPSQDMQVYVGGQPLTNTNAVNPLAEATEWFDGLSEADKTSILRNEFMNITTAFLHGEMPSLKFFHALMGEGATVQDLPPGGQELVGDLKHLTDSIDVLRSDFRILNDTDAPFSLSGMMRRSTTTLRNWVNKLDASRRVADHLQVSMKKMFLDAVGMTPPGKKPNVGAVEIPQALREEMVDAIQGMTSSPGKMQALLAKHPQLKGAFGTYFALAQQWEKMKLISPEMEAFFRDDVMFHSFPTMREIHRQATSSSTRNKLPYTRLATEIFRNIPTLEEARKMYQAAFQKVTTGGGWSQIPRAPGTAEARELAFIRGGETLQATVLGVDPTDSAGMRQVRVALLHLGLKNPVTDPSVIVGNHIKAVYSADATRQMIKDLANVPIPGMSIINGRTGRPYTVVDYFPATEKVDPRTKKTVAESGGIHAPFVPSFQQRGDALPPGVNPTRDPNSPARKMISFASDEFGMNPKTKIKFGRTEVNAEDLYIHPDVAEMIKDRFLGGDEWGKVWSGISEVIRSGQLMGAPMAHTMTIMSDHWMQLSGYALQSMASGNMSLKEGAKRLATAIPESVGLAFVGRELGDDVRLYADAQLHGANFNTWNEWVRTAASTAQEFLEQEMGIRPEGLTRGEQFFEDLTLKDSPGQAWNRMRDEQRLATGRGEWLGATAKGAANVAMNLDHMWNSALLFEPVKLGMLGAYNYWASVFYKDMGPKMLAEGYSQATVMRMAKEAAAQMVNTASGSLRQNQDSAFLKKVLYSPFGATAPGWFRGKIDALLSPLDGAFEAWSRHTGGPDQGRLGSSESPAMRNYMRKQWAGTLAFGLLGSWAALQTTSLLIWQHPTYNHPDPAQRFRLQHGNKSIPWPFFGFYRDLMKGVDGVSSGDIQRSLAVFTDWLMPVDKIPWELRANNAQALTGGQQQIFNPDRSWDPSVKGGQGLDILKYVGARMMSGPIETLGWENPAGAVGGDRMNIPKWFQQALTGIRVNDYNFPARVRGEQEKIEKHYEGLMRKQVQHDLQKWAETGDNLAFQRASQLALVDGIPVDGTGEWLFRDAGGVYRMDPETFQGLIESVKAPRAHYAEGIGWGTSRHRYESMMSKYIQQQQSIAERLWIQMAATKEAKK